MAKSDVETRDFFILQDVSNNVRTSGVGADGKFAYTVAVFVSAGVSAKFVAQILVLRFQRADPIVFHFDGKRAGFQIAEAFAEIIANHAIDDEHSVSIEGRSENFASRQVAPFVFGNNSAGLKPSQFRRKLSLKLGAMSRLAVSVVIVIRSCDFNRRQTLIALRAPGINSGSIG